MTYDYNALKKFNGAATDCIAKVEYLDLIKEHLNNCWTIFF